MSYQINRDYISEDARITTKPDGPKLLEESVNNFLVRNGVAHLGRTEWIDTECLALHMSWSNRDYTRAVVMLQALFIPEDYGYINYRTENYSFSIQFYVGEHHKHTYEDVAEYIDRARVNVSVKYKGKLV